MIRVGITGMGAISAAGPDVAALWSAASNGRSHIGRLSIPRQERLRIGVAAQIHDFDPAKYLTEEQIRRCDRYAQFVHVAAAEAVAQSGLAFEQLAGSRTAAIVGTGIGGIGTIDDGCFDFYSGATKVPAMTIPRLIPSSAPSHVSLTYGITGPCFAVSSACSSASQAIGLGLQLIRSGIVDRALVGGSDACLTPASIKAWEMLRVLSPDVTRPFSRDRNGMIMGEGGGMLLLESQSAIRERGGEPLVWLAGYGTTSDARDPLTPDLDGTSAAMRAALDDAGLEPEAIGYINAHGTGTAANDPNEAAAIRRVFGEATDTTPVSSTKPIIGHVLGGAGVLELIVTIEAVRHGVVPPQINMTEQDQACPLYLPATPLQRPIKAALSNSFAFGGINASLVVTAARP